MALDTTAAGIFLEDSDSSYFTLQHLAGCLTMMSIAGLSSLAGLGGGGPSVVVLILFFNVLPKEATIMVFACIMGSSFGNIINQAQRALDGQPVVNFGYAFVTIPVMFIGSIFGVFINRLLPSLATATIIIAVACISLPKIYNRFRQGYKRESDELLYRQLQDRHSEVIKQTWINPLANGLNLKILGQIGLLLVCFIFLSLLRGSSNFPSIINIENCSRSFWIIEGTMLCLCWIFYRRNRHMLEVWTAPSVTLGEQLFQKEDLIGLNEKIILRDSLGAGIFSGLGLGGGIFLVPLYRQLRLNPLQASSTCVFTVFITSTMNVIQALFMGVLSFPMFLFLFTMTASSSLVISIFVSNWLRKMNRTSYVELLLFILLVIANFILPYSLWLKYQNSGRDPSVVFGFGSLC